MHWVLQDRFNHDPKYRELKANLERMDITYSIASVVPFTDDGIEFTSGYDLNDLLPTGDYIVMHNVNVFGYGSYTLSKILAKHFSPGAYISPNLGINHLVEHYGDEMFNDDMIIAPIKDLSTDMDVFFTRPVEDTKSFCGGLMKNDEFNEWKDRIIKADKIPGNYSTITPNTMAVIAKVKPIHQEVRFFIVGGEIATYSQYKLGDQVIYSPVVDPYIVDYVNDVLKIWQPDHCFCMDIAVTNGVPKILETNSINSSGLYAIDTQKFIEAVEERGTRKLTFNIDVNHKTKKTECPIDIK